MEIREHKYLRNHRNLIPPTDAAKHFFEFCSCGDHGAHKVASPSLVELTLASKPHRWAWMRKLEKETFAAFMQEVTSAESDILALLKLPNIEKVRQNYLLGDSAGTGRTFTFSKEQSAGIDRIYTEWLTKIIGSQNANLKAVTIPEIDIYHYYMIQAFAASVEQVMKELESAKDRPVLLTTIMPDPEQRFLKAMMAEGTKRIKTKLALEHLVELKQMLEEMATNGDGSIKVGNALHNKFEGEAWYWKRITRSEAALAANAAYNAVAGANGVRYDEWSAAPSACMICSAFDGQVWVHGEGPQPVDDTHPHCLCLRIGLYKPSRGDVRPPWTRPSPYDQRYTLEEMQNLLQSFQPNRFSADHVFNT